MISWKFSFLTINQVKIILNVTFHVISYMDFHFPFPRINVNRKLVFHWRARALISYQRYTDNKIIYYVISSKPPHTCLDIDLQSCGCYFIFIFPPAKNVGDQKLHLIHCQTTIAPQDGKFQVHAVSLSWESTCPSLARLCHCQCRLMTPSAIVL
jgi:hypothetical protein